jgi:hypothetical protein
MHGASVAAGALAIGMLGVAVVATSSTAAPRASTAGELAVCINPKTGTLRATTKKRPKCRRGERRLVLGRGPVGPPGPAGAVGSSGAPGAGNSLVAWTHQTNIPFAVSGIGPSLATTTFTARPGMLYRVGQDTMMAPNWTNPNSCFAWVDVFVDGARFTGAEARWAQYSGSVTVEARMVSVALSGGANPPPCASAWTIADLTTWVEQAVAP